MAITLETSTDYAEQGKRLHVRFTISNRGPWSTDEVYLDLRPASHKIESLTPAADCEMWTCKFGYLGPGQTVRGQIAMVPGGFEDKVSLRAEVFGSRLELNRENNRQYLSVPLRRPEGANPGTALWSDSLWRPRGFAHGEEALYVWSSYDDDSVVQAYDRETGDVLWSYEFDLSYGGLGGWSGQLVSGLVLAGDKVLFGYAPGYLDALDASTGDLTWRFQVADLATPRPIVFGDNVYLATVTQGSISANTLGSLDRGTVYSLDLGSGAVNWEHEVEENGRFVGSPNLDAEGGKFILPYRSESGYSVYALDTSEGQVSWTLDGQRARSFVPYGRNVYFFASGKIHSLDAGAGRLNWQVGSNTGSRVPGLLVDDDRLYYCGNGSLRSLDTGSGRMQWSTKFASECPHDQANRPVLSDGHVFIGGPAKNQEIYAIESDSGDLKWSRRSSHSPTIPAVAGGGKVYLFDETSVVAVDIASGKKEWDYYIGGGQMQSLSLADGILFGATDRRLFAIRASR